MLNLTLVFAITRLLGQIPRVETAFHSPATGRPDPGSGFYSTCIVHPSGIPLEPLDQEAPDFLTKVPVLGTL